MTKNIKELKKQGLFRELRCLNQQGSLVEYNGKRFINFSSNDYLGISDHLDWQKDFIESLNSDQYLFGALSSRLLTGSDTYTEELESYIGSLYKRSCLLYNSGYHANIGILPTVTEKNDLILADKLVHASIIDGLRLCSCEWKRFKHNDYNDLERLLKQSESKYDSIYIVTESIFSMDGDTADLRILAELKNKYNAQLYVDEAHAFGVRGKQGLGLTEEIGLLNEIDFIVCTLGKASASEGAFIICDDSTKSWLINKSRSFIFTTAASPISHLWIRFIMEKIVSMQRERQYLKEITQIFREKLDKLELLGNTHIVPLVFKDNNKCLTSAEQLQSEGIWAMAIRYPSVPLNQPRIRFSLTASHKKEQIQQAYECILAQQEK